MTSEDVTEHIGFACPRCGHRWSEDFAVRHIHTASGMDRSYYRLGGVAVLCPYTAAGALPCGRCSWSNVIGHLASTSAPPADQAGG